MIRRKCQIECDIDIDAMKVFFFRDRLVGGKLQKTILHRPKILNSLCRLLDGTQDDEKKVEMRYESFLSFCMKEIVQTSVKEAIRLLPKRYSELMPSDNLATCVRYYVYHANLFELAIKYVKYVKDVRSKRERILKQIKSVVDD